MGDAFKRASYLGRATAWAILLGIIETVTSKRGRRVLALLALGGLAAGFVLSKPIRTIEPQVVGIRANRLTGGVSTLTELGYVEVAGWRPGDKELLVVPEHSPEWKRNTLALRAP